MDLMDLEDNELLSKNHLAELNSKFEKELQKLIGEKLKTTSDIRDDLPQNDVVLNADFLRKAHEHSKLKKEQHFRNRQIIKECKKLISDVEKSDKKIQFVNERLETLEKDLTLNKQELNKMASNFKKAIQKYTSTLNWVFEVRESENPKELHVTSNFIGKNKPVLFVIDREQRHVIDWSLVDDCGKVERSSDYKTVLKEIMLSASK
ncbi:uncharacterized protein LOC126738274 isoform X2 [Anthonomus grandis grandis]|uniref:uncharacterized protein LOC126738274 isoform X2 n=1 Tax=Anthonomus grandis grandis TaxID=2921223 RepID=UPI0021658795|nr:uncharacterized protein LOC126738274 isoform X2 [Anthonomus grandis grandis]